MRFTEISESTTTAGSVSSVAMPMMAQARESVSVPGLKPVQYLMKGKVKKKGSYGNSISESKVNEEEISEQDLIIVPGQGRTSKTGLIKHGQSRLDHEVEMARSDLFSAAKNAKTVYHMIKDVSEEEGLEGWVQEKIIKANDYLNTIREYLEGKQLQGVAEELSMQHQRDHSTQKYADTSNSLAKRTVSQAEVPNVTKSADGHPTVRGRADSTRKTYATRVDPTITPTSVKRLGGDRPIPSFLQKGVAEGTKVDRMVKHVKSSEKKLGHSDKEAENIAWATANKRGMLDNKNKKK